MMVFSKFLNAFTIILEFSITGRVGTHGNDFFYFLSFTAFPNLIWFEKTLWWCFLIFWIFFTIFLEFSITGRVDTNQDNFFSLFLALFQPILAWKEALLVFSNFLNFFAIFLEFSIPSRVGTHRNYFFFILSLSRLFATYFG